MKTTDKPLLQDFHIMGVKHLKLLKRINSFTAWTMVLDR